MPIPSQVPVRYPSGVSTDPPYGPLANFGQPNPFMYHYFEDDFDVITSLYTQTKTGNGTIALAAGDGGIGLFTTNSSTPAGTDVCQIQLPVAGFTYTAGKKMFFLVRLQVSDAINAGIVVGLKDTSATPFTINDGIVFRKVSGAANNLQLLVVRGTAFNLNSVIPTTSYTLANNTNIDLGFYVDRNGSVQAFVGSQLVGWLPQSERPAGQVAGPVTQGAVTGTGFPVANLNLTVAVQSGTASSKTMTVDFVMAAKER